VRSAADGGVPMEAVSISEQVAIDQPAGIRQDNELHATRRAWLARSAAKRRLAWMSSASRSG
jgi:hypothetical protein